MRQVSVGAVHAPHVLRHVRPVRLPAAQPLKAVAPQPQRPVQPVVRHRLRTGAPTAALGAGREGRADPDRRRRAEAGGQKMDAGRPGGRETGRPGGREPGERACSMRNCWKRSGPISARS